MIHEFVTVEELSRRTGVPESKIRDLVHSKKLGHHIINGREIRIPYEETLRSRILEPYKVPPKPEPEPAPPETDEGIKVEVTGPDPRADRPKGGKRG